MEDVVRVISKAIIISIVIVSQPPIKDRLFSAILPASLIPSVFGGSGAVLPLPSLYGTGVIEPVMEQKGAPGAPDEGLNVPPRLFAQRLGVID